MYKLAFTLYFAFAFAAPAANIYTQHNLVSDIPGMADQTDPNLTNPWGIGLSATSPFWISNNHSGNTTVFNGAGQPFPSADPIVVNIPAPASAAAPGAVTGQVFNDTSGFNLSGKPALFLFATEDGDGAGWNSSADPRHATIMADNSPSGAVY
jgi:uncharacterized protein (TIGR03118 family)